MKFKDKIDSYTIEYNSPAVRLKIRHHNAEISGTGIFYHKKFDLAKFCLDLLEKFFPMVDYIWCDWYHFTHCIV